MWICDKYTVCEEYSFFTSTVHLSSLNFVKWCVKYVKFLCLDSDASSQSSTSRKHKKSKETKETKETKEDGTVIDSKPLLNRNAILGILSELTKSYSGVALIVAEHEIQKPGKQGNSMVSGV